MRCVVPHCGNDWNNAPRSLSYYRFPEELSVRVAWLSALRLSWVSALCSSGAAPGVTVCADHFWPEDQVEVEGRRVLKPGAVPFPHVRLKDDRNLPPYVCGECGIRLLGYVQLRNCSLQAHSTLRNVIKTHGVITPDFISSVRELDPFNRNLTDCELDVQKTSTDKISDDVGSQENNDETSNEAHCMNEVVEDNEISEVIAKNNDVLKDIDDNQQTAKKAVCMHLKEDIYDDASFDEHFINEIPSCFFEPEIIISEGDIVFNKTDTNESMNNGDIKDRLANLAKTTQRAMLPQVYNLSFFVYAKTTQRAKRAKRNATVGAPGAHDSQAERAARKHSAVATTL